MTPNPSENITLDRLDRQLLHALQFDGRVSFRVLSEILGASEQTVARRYRRLREAGVVRVVVLSAPAGGQYWIVRMQVVPGGANKLAQALARRSDVGWLSIFSGGSEVTCVCRPQSVGQRDALLLDRLPETELVTSLVSHATLTQFAGGRAEFAVCETGMGGRLLRQRLLRPALDCVEIESRPGQQTDRALIADAKLAGDEADQSFP